MISLHPISTILVGAFLHAPVHETDMFLSYFFLLHLKVLCSLKVEKLVIPAIAELTQSWITVFGFTHLEESLKQEMKSLNMLVFPGIDMLQKLVVGQGKHEGNATAAGVDTVFFYLNKYQKITCALHNFYFPYSARSRENKKWRQCLY